MSAYPFSYLLHGLAIRSSAEIPELAAVRSETERTDVQLEWLPELATNGELEPAGPATWVDRSVGGGEMRAWSSVTEEGRAVRLRFGYGDAAVVMDFEADGKRMRTVCTAGVPSRNAAMLLQSTGVRYLLHLQGRPALHAAVVERDGIALALVGEQGAGKSTTAAALARRGYRVLCDDLAALCQENGAWSVYPGPPSLRLTPDTLEALGREANPTHPVWARPHQMAAAEYQGIVDKVLVCPQGAPRREPGRPVPLAAIYVLLPRCLESTAALVRPLSPAIAMGELAHHLSNCPLPGHGSQIETFRTLAALAQSCPVRGVERPDDLAALSLVCDAILADAMPLHAEWDVGP